MPVDPQIQALLDRGTGVPATHTLPVDVARAQYEARIALMAPAADIASVRERTIDAAGGPLRIRIYTPHGTGPFPLLVFFHGSGFVLCSLDTHDGMCRNLCAGSACVVASVDYRLAPEHKFPAGPEDCLHATRWAGMHAVELGADRTRIAVAGDSAGARTRARCWNTSPDVRHGQDAVGESLFSKPRSADQNMFLQPAPRKRCRPHGWPRPKRRPRQSASRSCGVCPGWGGKRMRVVTKREGSG